MFFYSARQINRDAGIEGFVRAFEEVEIIHDLILAIAEGIVKISW